MVAYLNLLAIAPPPPSIEMMLRTVTTIPGVLATPPWGRRAVVVTVVSPLVSAARSTGKRRIQESAAGDVESRPNLATPADLDDAVPAAQLQENLLARSQLRLME